jgi:hypothetical protein
MQHYYPGVPGLGNVAVSRHAQERMDECGVSEEQFRMLLVAPTKPDVNDSPGVVWRERNGMRAVILTRPTPFRGAALVKTVYRVLPQLQAG